MVTAIVIDLVALAGLGLYGWWAMTALAAGRQWWVVALALPVAYVAIFVVVTLVWFAMAWIWGAQRPPDVRLSPGRALRMVRDELFTLMGSGSRMGFAWWWMREPRPAQAAAPVLLLHGVLCNAGVWMRMLGVLKSARIGPVYTLTYGPPLASIEYFADQVAQAIARIRADTGAARISLVGHSMGGIVARAYMRRYGSAAIDRVITIGTPHHGSVHAWLFPGVSLSQLRPRNPWLRELDAAPMPSVRIVSIWSWHDSMVAPQDSARLENAVNVAISGVAHNALLRDPEVAALVVRELQRPLENADAARAATSGSPA